VNSPNRVDRIVRGIQSVLEEISGRDLSTESPAATFSDLGLDSLLLTQGALAMSRQFKAKVKLKHLAEDFPSCRQLAEYLDQTLPATAFAETAPAMTKSVLPIPVSPSAVSAPMQPSAVSVSAAPPTPPSLAGPTVAMPPLRFSAPGGASSSTVEELVRFQLSIMTRQLELLAGAPASAAALAAPPLETAPLVAAASPTAQPQQEQPAAAVSAAPQGEKEAAQTGEKPRGHGPQLVIDRSKGNELTPTQEKHLERLIQRYTAKTAASKAFTARNRKQISDPRTVAGFRPRLKELVYPIVAKRSSGCRLWDLDGNEYIDLLGGYGSNFFGFGAPFIRKAIAEQMELGMEIGPQTWLAEEVASLFREFVPFDRVAFCNTGSEAVLATLRLARTVTGRDLIVMFAGGYHGIFDEVVVRSTKTRSMPAAPGIPRAAVDNILVLPWADPAAFEIIRQRADEIAAVLVEPVQSRAPHIQPAEFLKELRKITLEIGSALIFDEVVCGFRVAPGGAQEHFGIQADMGSYGKVVGGGLSIGIVAGKREYMDALDGGHWEYGDTSVPEVGVTYFAGTFVRHPIAMAAAKASLLYMKEQGPALQRRVNETSQRFADQLNALFRSQEAPIELRHFGSVMKFALTSDIPYGEIVFAHLRERGIHVWDGRPCYMTMAHEEKDLATVVEMFRQAIGDMQDGGFYPRPVVQSRADTPPMPGARLGRDAQGNPTWFVPDPANPSRHIPLARE
jgi:glutamate-1-semialdehyde aminotransferase/acyl carrier protein